MKVVYFIFYLALLNCLSAKPTNFSILQEFNSNSKLLKVDSNSTDFIIKNDSLFTNENFFGHSKFDSILGAYIIDSNKFYLTPLIGRE